MGNIENSIKHLQSSIKRRTILISYAAQEVEDFKFYMKIWSKTINNTVRTRLNYTTAKCRLAQLVKQQKTEKKMLAMMIYINRTYRGKFNTLQVRAYFGKLDSL